MQFDQCVSYCRSYQDKPIQIDSEETAENIRKFLAANCREEKVWMGYKSEGGGKHYWLDQNLEFSTPVPEEHIAVSEKLDCNYWLDKKMVYYFQAKPGSDNWKECKEHGFST